MLAHRLRRSANIKSTLAQRLVFAGSKVEGLRDMELQDTRDVYPRLV